MSGLMTTNNLIPMPPPVLDSRNAQCPIPKRSTSRKSALGRRASNVDLLTLQRIQRRGFRIESCSSPQHFQSSLHKMGPKSTYYPDSQLLQEFEGKSVYTLGYINSLVVENNLIYNLLSPVLVKSKSQIKCRCTNSKCSSGYCQCFSKGVGCGIECRCVNCLNLGHVWGGQGVQETANEAKGCNCKKSNCVKKYCQCHKQGNRCTQMCGCADCLNQ